MMVFRQILPLRFQDPGNGIVELELKNVPRVCERRPLGYQYKSFLASTSNLELL